MREIESTTALILDIIQAQVGGCREWPAGTTDRCWAPAEYVLWGKLIPAEGLGPRCYDHAAKWVGHDALRTRTQYALIHLEDLASQLTHALLPLDFAENRGQERDA